MRKETIVTGKTVEDALLVAAKELGASVEDLETPPSSDPKDRRAFSLRAARSFVRRQAPFSQERPTPSSRYRGHFPRAYARRRP